MSEVKKEWVRYGECLKCGEDAEVLTASKKENWVIDGDEARCADPECGNTGHVSVEDSECADIIWDNGMDLEDEDE